MMPPNTYTTWTASPPGRARRGAPRVLAVLATAAALLGTLMVASPTSADEGSLVVGTHTFSSRMWGDAGDIGDVELDTGYPPHNSFHLALHAGASSDGTDVDRPSWIELRATPVDGPVAGWPDEESGCVAANGTGTYQYEHEDPESGDLTWRTLDLSDGEFIFLPPPILSLAYVVRGRWDDGAGNSGVFVGSGWIHRPSFETCTNFSDWNDESDTYGEIVFLTEGGGDLPDVSEILDLVDIGDSQFNESKRCEDLGGPPIFDTTTEGVRTFVYTYQPTADEAWICARVEDTSTGEGYGGRLEATPGDADPQVTGLPGTPTTDSNSTACTDTTDPSNEVPGTHPISSGVVATVDYMIDAYANDSEAWVCLQVENQDLRVIVPLGSDDGSAVTAGTIATWWPDPGTPSP